MNFKKPLLSGLLSVALLASLLTPALAYNSQGSNTDRTEGSDEVQEAVTQYYDGLEGKDTANTEVYATRASTFTALIPKTIILDGIDGDAQYVVGAKGDVLDADSITIEPNSNELTLYKKGDASKTVNADIEQLNTVITGAQIKEDVYSTLEGSIQAEGLKAGSWSGQMSFIITLTQTNVPVHKHTLTHVEAVEATEEAAGNIEYWHCTDCDKYYRDAECTQEISEAETVLPQLNHTHNMVYTAAKDPTATANGNIEYWYCSKCGKYYSDANGVNEISVDDIAIIPAPFTVTNSNRAKVGYTGTENEELVILTVFKDTDGTWYRVTEIGWSAFSGSRSLTSVTIPDSVTSIGESAFSGCENLTSITIPNSVTTIKGSAFNGCFSLRNIDIPASVLYIGNDAFRECTSIIELFVPSTVNYVGDGAFENVNRIYYSGTLDTINWGAGEIIR